MLVRSKPCSVNMRLAASRIAAPLARSFGRPGLAGLAGAVAAGLREGGWTWGNTIPIGSVFIDPSWPSLPPVGFSRGLAEPSTAGRIRPRPGRASEAGACGQPAVRIAVEPTDIRTPDTIHNAVD